MQILPPWARVFRITLMVFHGIGILGVFLVIFVYIFPLGPGPSGKMYLTFPLLFAWLGFIFLSIPYLIANVTYGILWLSKIRGRGYRTHTLGTVFLVTPPAFIGISVVGWFAFAAS
jgi:hypothetical protein